ncbi:hypothetical protein EDB80DRAFT_704864 [Ilyonectria destructans]|nr:hypothetical protein EDB80DRAFT_704864 [Ilyonectria destructans]
MDTSSTGDMVEELHDDLARKYTTHVVRVENIWRSLNKLQRARCLKAGAADGAVLKHPFDTSLGNVYKLVPELNLRDITEPGSDFLLDLLKYRATKSLFEQYCAGINGGPGDRAFIHEMMEKKGLRHAESFKDCHTFFMEGQYGTSIRIMAEHAETLADFAPAIQAGLCIPQATGELILQRQIFLLQSLTILIDDILEEGSKTRSRKKPPTKSSTAATAALSKLTLEAPAVKLELPDLVSSARNQRDTFEEDLNLLSTEPVVLAHAVNFWYFSRPDLVADEKGRRLPVHTDKFISGAVFDAIHSAIQGAAIWKYIDRLLELLASFVANKVYRAIVLQEISNICHLEYSRAQSIFKRHIQTGLGTKWFKRTASTYDNAGSARVTMKGNPEDLTRSDPQLHFVLRLCQPETNAVKAVDWINKLSKLHETYPTEREKLCDREASSLCDLAVIIGFIQDLSSAIPMPSLSRKKGQLFVSRSQELERELSLLKKQVDLRDFAVPIDNLLEPNMAENALKTLDQFIIDQAGTKVGFMYQDLVDDCFSDLEAQYERERAKLEQKNKPEVVTLLMSTPQQPEERVEQRRQKEKTRPSHSSTYEIAPSAESPAAEELAPSSQTFRVGSSTAEVFSTIFAKSQARGSVNWAAFEAAMADLGFSVLPKFGSIYTFNPPEPMTVKRSLTLHRPHKSRIEGYLLLIFARRLKRVYGWGEQTFETI